MRYADINYAAKIHIYLLTSNKIDVFYLLAIYKTREYATWRTFLPLAWTTANRKKLIYEEVIAPSSMKIQ
jgi:hypothetical protein